MPCLEFCENFCEADYSDWQKGLVINIEDTTYGGFWTTDFGTP